MGFVLVDYRAKITEETDVWLEVESRRTGVSMSELGRHILHDYVALKINEAILLCNALEKKGIKREDAG